MSRIFVIGNGPSADNVIVRGWRNKAGEAFSVNHWTLNDGGSFGLRCDKWFIGEHNESWLPVVAAKTFALARASRPTVYAPGLNMAKCADIAKQIKPWPLRIQREHPNLCSACRWTTDPRPMRPTSGSLALAVAVAEQPNELYIAGIDLYQHSAGTYSSNIKPPDYTDGFADKYLTGMHANHSVVADLRYIRSALESYTGKVICVSSVLKRKFGNIFPAWSWLDG